MADDNIPPPPSSSQPSQIQPEETEHWSVRLKKIPLPCGRTHEDLAANSWKPWHGPNPNPTPTHPTPSFRRSQRLFQKSKKKPEDCVLYPPYYGRPSPTEELAIAIKQRQAQLKKRKRLTPSTFKPSPQQVVHLTEKEKKEILERLANNPDPDPPRYEDYTSSDSFVPTHPVLSEINEATLAIVGWLDKKKDVGNT